MKFFFLLQITLILLSNSILLFGQSQLKEKEDSLLLYREGKFKEAISNTLEEIRLNPNNLDARTILIWSLIAIGEYKRAEKEAVVGLGIKKYDIRIIQALGEAYFFQKNYENALKYFQEYISLDSKGARIIKVYNLIADSFYELKRYNEADFAYEHALRFAPNNQNLLIKLARSRINANNKILAEEALIKLLTISPNNLEAKNLLEELKKNNSKP
ncbi:tetratricopeptide repeat protein [Borreliella garinii]|uniref:tetratricopeptide repeat protein n=1 Tax=Borreliella garinii TaxID=29519 RepID=UPI00292E530C|nr:tetratricopeptide repeat protein [Borreliella garinii]WNZ73669.1 tetratricopeptide repeat protein [Borreliella garinii]WNZ74647.1 tetratricopeptide repeat protein [Borreliella garinii]